MREVVLGALVAAPFVMGAAVAAPADDAAPQHEVTRFADPAIAESSGLVVAGDLAVTMNDSGDGARVFTVDLATGKTVGTTRWRGDVTDLEALAPLGADEVWVGDIGDNNRARTAIKVTRVPVGKGDRDVAGQTYRLGYPDERQDAEALVRNPVTGRLFVITKNALGGRIYAAPEQLSPTALNVMTKVGDAPGLVTDAAFFPDGRHLLVRNYVTATLLTFPQLQAVATFRLPDQQQGEGLAIDDDDRIMLSSEGVGAPLLRIELPAAAQAARAGTPDPEARRSAAEEAQPAEPSGTGWSWVLLAGLGVIAVGGAVVGVRSR